MLTNAFKLPAKSSKKLGGNKCPPVINITAAMSGMSLQDSSSYLKNLIGSPSVQSEVMQEANNIAQAVCEFHAILDDDKIKNKLECLNLNFAATYADELKKDAKFLTQLSRNLSAYYNRFIIPLAEERLAQNTLYENIAVRTKKIMGSVFLKQYIPMGDPQYGEIALSLDIILIMNNMESVRELFNILFGMNALKASNYIVCVRDIEQSLSRIEALERDMFLLLELAFSNSRNSDVLESYKSHDLNTWCNDKAQIDRVSQNLYNLHLSFLRCAVFKTQLYFALGDYKNTSFFTEKVNERVKWAVNNITTLLCQATCSKEEKILELLRNSSECKKIIGNIEDRIPEHPVQYDCYQAATTHKASLSFVDFNNIYTLLKSNEPVGELIAYSDKFTVSLELYDALINCKDKDILMAAYRHLLLWQQWFGGLKDKQNLSGKVCVNYLTRIGIQLKGNLQEEILLAKEAQIKLEVELAVQNAEKAMVLLIQEEHEQQIEKKIAAQKKQKQKLEQSRIAKEKTKFGLQEKIKAEAQKKKNEERLLQEKEKLKEQKKTNQERVKQEREQQKRENAARKKKEIRTKQRGRKKAKQKQLKKGQSEQFEQENLEAKKRETEQQEIGQEQLEAKITEAEQQENKAKAKVEMNCLIKSSDSFLIEDQKNEGEKRTVVDELIDDSLSNSSIKTDQVKEWTDLRCTQSLFEKILIPEHIRQLMSEIECGGYYIVLYGGFPRDSLLNLRINDYDLVTDCPIETLMMVRDFAATLRPNCYTLGPFVDMSVISGFDLVEFSKSRYLAANALFATKEGRVFAAIDEIYALFKSPYLLQTGNIRTAFEEDPSRILRTVYYTNHTHKPLTKETVSAMVYFSELIRQKVPFGVVRARLGDLFLRGNGNQSFALLLELKIAHHIVAGLGSVGFKSMNTDDYLYQFMADQFSQIDFFISHGNNSKTRYDALALLLLPYHQELLRYKKEVSQNCAVLAASLFCDEYSIFGTEKTKLTSRLALMIENYGIQFLYFQSKKHLSLAQMQVFPAPLVFMHNQAFSSFSASSSLPRSLSNLSYDEDFPKLGKKGMRI